MNDTSEATSEGRNSKATEFNEEEEIGAKERLVGSVFERKEQSLAAPLPPPPPPPPLPLPSSTRPSSTTRLYFDGSFESKPIEKNSFAVSNYIIVDDQNVENKTKLNIPEESRKIFDLPLSFKEELLKKHSKLISSRKNLEQFNEFESSSIPKVTKTRENLNYGRPISEDLSKLKLSDKTTNTSSLDSKSDQFRSVSADSNMYLPAKLYASLGRGDKKPFAYIAEVNDPNNRGKLDLSQIKSAAMKRRLLANMASSEERDDQPEERDQDSDDGQENDSSNSYYNHHHNHHQQSSPSNYRQAQRNKPFYQKPNIVHHTSAKWQQLNNNQQQQYATIEARRVPEVNYNKQRHTENVVIYNKPVQFYENNNNYVSRDLSSHQRSISVKQSPITRYHKENSMDGYLTELGFEVEKSLESLEQLVSSMGSSHSRDSRTTDVDRQRVRDNKPIIQYHQSSGSNLLEPIYQNRELKKNMPRQQSQNDHHHRDNQNYRGIQMNQNQSRSKINHYAPATSGFWNEHRETSQFIYRPQPANITTNLSPTDYYY